MTAEQDESTVTITGAAPGTIVALRRAAAIAAEHGHNWIGVEDLLAAIVTATPLSILEVHWPRQGGTPLNRGEINDFDPSAPQQALTFDEIKALVQSIIPGAPNGPHGPAEPAAVTYKVRGPHAEEFRAGIERQT
ncbi:hypothetical protein OHA40_03935 [Nocardia sp. NBC_00508]|uniref:hypothetical protein n=1 Tax=Nocardia sp. NBC_00508 TaxID=2975992 RepID=UPI002E8247D4|nr:hypothetical protein [Nocardia sp. NBC_00508]WUD67318.1 hypothetical protein OHA40_03935 [Nocardia sp. NBC_00508]